ncbi:MAG: hypothetical protein KatS3mg115_0435 [Candidatus Poribacteria bacterium]|nr:MAG: hypothetical protein KatS3mg115_0435 [Candidatus Poribacteria bacterium]
MQRQNADRSRTCRRGLWLLGTFLLLLLRTAEGAESFAGEFLTLGVGGRALGLGGAYAALATDATAAYWNPAGVAQLERRDLGLMHSTLFGMDRYDFVGLAVPVGPTRWGIGWIRLGVDEIILTRVPHPGEPVSSINRPERVGTASVSQNAFLLTAGRRLAAWRAMTLFGGVGGKLLYLTAPGGVNALGAGLDLGLLSVWNLDSRGAVRGAIVFQDATTTTLFWNTVPAEGEVSHRDRIRPNLRLGLAYVRRLPRWDSQLTWSLQLDTKQRLELKTGLEWELKELVAFRLGLLERKSTAAALRDFSVGAGFRLGFVGGQAFRADYAFTSGELGGSHRVSLGVQF